MGGARLLEECSLLVTFMVFGRPRTKNFNIKIYNFI
jgi:hypothetical protein